MSMAVWGPMAASAQGDSTAVQNHAMSGMHEAMAGHMGDGPHMRMTSLQAAQAGDAERAAAIVTALRTALAQYTDYHRALADGFAIFAPRVPQHIYHFTRQRGAFIRALSFDPTRPTSLLYEKTGDSTYRLVGAMYTAPHGMSLAGLNERVPLSVAQWHEHVNFCVPPHPRDISQWLQRDSSGHMEFGMHGSIDTDAGCAAVGGFFLSHFAGWMVHVYPFESDTAAVWGRGSMEHM
jgi:hypothetical protein